MSNELRPVAVYNCDKQELVGIFGTTKIASRFIYGRQKGDAMRSLLWRLGYKCRIHPKSSNHDFILTVRYASKEQQELIKEKPYYFLHNEYKPANCMQDLRF